MLPAVDIPGCSSLLLVVIGVAVGPRVVVGGCGVGGVVCVCVALLVLLAFIYTHITHIITYYCCQLFGII